MADETTSALLENVELSADTLEEFFFLLVAEHGDYDSDAVVAEMATAGYGSCAAFVVAC